MTRPRDSQRTRVYGWEQTSVPDGKALSLAEAQELTHWAMAQYGVVSAIEVTDGRRRRIAAYKSWGNTIALPRWARTQRVVIHEAAHAVLDKKGGLASDWASHGREFVRVQIDLYDRLGLIERKAAMTSARAARVKVASRGDYPRMIGVRTVSRLERLRAQRDVMKRDLAAIEAEIAALKRGESIAARKEP